MLSDLAPVNERKPAWRLHARAWISALLLSLALAAGLAAQGETGARATIESIRLDVEGGLELRMVTSGTLRLVGVEMDPDGSLVVQLPRHLPGPSPRISSHRKGW